MLIAYFDSGTSNSRLYLLQDKKIMAQSTRAVGSRDSALAKDKNVLVGALYEMYAQLLQEKHLNDRDIEQIWMSGMITCPNGLYEVEHLSTPVDSKTLKAAVVCYKEPTYFKREIHLVPGLKTIARGKKATLTETAEVNNVRGEEIEAVGLLAQYPALKNDRSVIVMPGSHTQVLTVKDGVIDNIISNVTGELYAAILKNSIIGASVQGGESSGIDSEMVVFGAKNVSKYGFNRALYIVRSMDLFSDSTVKQRYSALEGVLNAGIMIALKNLLGDEKTALTVAGSQEQYEIFKALSVLYPNFTISKAAAEKMPFSVSGVLELLK
jgi:2-dehydro-3-deoxygalactonokinase